jgi:hypothetical protein
VTLDTSLPVPVGYVKSKIGFILFFCGRHFQNEKKQKVDGKYLRRNRIDTLLI